MMKSSLRGMVLALLLGPLLAWAAAPTADVLAGLTLRGIGPAFMSGRIADIAIDPADPSVWYVAVGSGGVWKTVNAGTTWTSLFDGQGSYSIGTVVIDPHNRHRIWVGTGENVGGRHAGYGDGVYRSDDAGATWQHLGLKASERISRIVVHPEDPNIVWVAAQGPLWSAGGERGLYMSSDAGKTWTQSLSAGPWTGVTDLLIDPRDPDRLYAATWQRQRSVAAYLGGGPESGLQRSSDGGKTWEKLSRGLPEGAMGKIGMAISPQNPDVLYAVIELDRRTGGVYRSADRGSSWKKMSDTVSGGTGPHYYHELYASPHAFDRIYLADVTMQVSEDGGTTFRKLVQTYKHSDDHALAFRADDPDYLLVGSDGGLYESHDLSQTWRYLKNLPITQFYKVAVDDDAPFYNVYGGTQDNASQGGPSRTDNVNGIRNDDWFVTLFGDGHQSATEPGNPDIVYAEWQEGNLVRFDRTTGEIVYIKPQADAGDVAERFNWDAPILVSPHQPTRLYFASQRVWRSDDRGDTWRPVSGDLSRQRDRLRMPLMGRQQSWDAAWDVFAMSDYATVTSLAESPRQEGLLYAGTDDGLIQVSEDGGGQWRSIDVGSLPGVPSEAFVNDIKADLFDADTVYVALDNHKNGDFRPLLLVSRDRGRRWTSMAGDLPARHLVWRVVQDHVERRLFFAATEFGLFVSVDAGQHWVALKGDAPTISFRDVAIQRRENDLVAASFGRGIFILDDYSPLRAIAADKALDAKATLFEPRPAWWYIERRPIFGPGKGYQGDDYYVAPNPDFGAVFTYFLKDDLDSRTQARQAKEKPLLAKGEDTPVPGWTELGAETREAAPVVMVVVRDGSGQVVRRVEGPVKAGLHRVAWDLRYPPLDAIGTPGSFIAPEPIGFLAATGTYSATLESRVDGQLRQLAGPVPVQVNRLRKGALPGAEPDAVAAFGQRVARLNRVLSAASLHLPLLEQRLTDLQEALRHSQADATLDRQLDAARQRYFDLRDALFGDPNKAALKEPQADNIGSRYFHAYLAAAYSTYGPTPAHLRSMDLAEAEYADLRARVNAFTQQELPALEQALLDAGAPWTRGQRLPEL
jgi:photosystem II stability/assembly factor-like uncharacterized protein